MTKEGLSILSNKYSAIAEVNFITSMLDSMQIDSSLETIIDFTAGYGGTMIALCKEFDYVIGFEYDLNNVEISRHNLAISSMWNSEVHYGDGNVLIENVLRDSNRNIIRDTTDTSTNTNITIAYMDASWGDTYKEAQAKYKVDGICDFDLFYADNNIIEVINRLKEEYKFKVVFIKVPLFYNYADLKANCKFTNHVFSKFPKYMLLCLF